MTAFDRDQLIDRLHQIRRPLQFAAGQNFSKVAIVQDLETRLLEWLDAAAALPVSPDIAANLDACRRLFRGFDQADPPTKRTVITTALGRLDHLFALFQIPRFEATVRFGEHAIQAADRKLLAEKLWQAVTKQFIPVEASEEEWSTVIR